MATVPQVRLDSVFIDPFTGVFATRTYIINIIRYSLPQMASYYRFARVGEAASCTSACNNAALFCSCGGIAL